MKPNKREGAGPEREGEKRTGGGSSGSESRPEKTGSDEEQTGGMEKERDIPAGEAGEEEDVSGAGEESGGTDAA